MHHMVDYVPLSNGINGQNLTIDSLSTSASSEDNACHSASEVVLAGFSKTDNLQPGESGIVTITFETDNIASYDYLGYIASDRGTDKNGNPKFGGYVLEQGDYEIRIQSDAQASLR